MILNIFVGPLTQTCVVNKEQSIQERILFSALYLHWFVCLCFSDWIYNLNKQKNSKRERGLTASISSSSSSTVETVTELNFPMFFVCLVSVTWWLNTHTQIIHIKIIERWIFLIEKGENVNNKKVHSYL